MEKGIDLREQILKLYKDYYHGGLMKLVVIGGGEVLFHYFYFIWLVNSEGSLRTVLSISLFQAIMYLVFLIQANHGK